MAIYAKCSAHNNHDKRELHLYIDCMNSLNKILKDAIKLPEDQRLSLVHRLLTAGEPVASEDVKQAWDIEIRNRIERYDRGEVRSRLAGKILSDLDHQLKI